MSDSFSSSQDNAHIFAQTVVFDCCHPTSTMDDGWPSVGFRSGELESSIYDHVDRDIWDSIRRGSGTSPDLLPRGLKSHMLITACSPSEVAQEVDDRGRLSLALLRLLNSISPDELRYCDILSNMDPIPRYAWLFLQISNRS